MMVAAVVVVGCGGGEGCSVGEGLMEGLGARERQLMQGDKVWYFDEGLKEITSCY